MMYPFLFVCISNKKDTKKGQRQNGPDHKRKNLIFMLGAVLLDSFCSSLLPRAFPALRTRRARFGKSGDTKLVFSTRPAIYCLLLVQMAVRSHALARFGHWTTHFNPNLWVDWQMPNNCWDGVPFSFISSSYLPM